MSDCIALIRRDAVDSASDGGHRHGRIVLFRTDNILVTPAVVRFGPVSYQVATITSVAVYHRQRLNPIAVTLVLAAAAFAAFAYLGREQYPDYSLWSAIASPVALILGVAWQRFRPVLEYSFVMKTAGGETETITTRDRAQVFELRDAIENAFRPADAGRASRHRPRGVAGHRRRPAPTTASYITRDWVVANRISAPGERDEARSRQSPCEPSALRRRLLPSCVDGRAIARRQGNAIVA